MPGGVEPEILRRDFRERNGRRRDDERAAMDEPARRERQEHAERHPGIDAGAPAAHQHRRAEDRECALRLLMAERVKRHRELRRAEPCRGERPRQDTGDRDYDAQREECGASHGLRV